MKYSIGISNSSKKTNSNTHNISAYSIFKKYSTSKPSTRNNSGKKEKKPLSPKAKKIIYIAVGVVFLGICVCLLAVGIYLKNLEKNLPSAQDLFTRQTDQSTQILDRNGTVLYTIYGNQNRELVKLDQIPNVTKWAVLAAEDVEFYQHKGIDYKSIAAAMLRNLKAGGITGGASTITQQLVRNTILYDVLGNQAYDQTYTRKIKEILITLQVEQKYSKDEILEAYLNDVPLGGVNYGLEAAAQAYFAKDVQDLDLAESAMLAGIIQSPGVYSPLFGTNPDAAKDRQTYVLDQMLKHKDLTGVTEDEVNAAKSEVLVYNSTPIDIKAPHFVFYVEQMLEEQYGADRVKNGGLKVTTTLDYSLQQIAEDEVTKGVNNAKKLNVNNGAMVVLDPNNGQVLAMVGSVDYWNTDDPRVDGNVNVTLSPRQMGSSIKPFVYLTAFQEGYGPWMEAPDMETESFGTYDPTDWDSQYMGTMTARKAIVYSRNVPAVYTLQLGGISNFLQTAQTVGITTLSDKSDYGLSLALGSGEETLLEHAAAYSILANGGTKYTVNPILKVEDSSGAVLEDYTTETPTGTRVYEEKDIYMINWMLCDLNNFGDRPDNAYYYINGKKVCGKTGTTDGPKDLTTVLYDQSLVVAVWNGNNNGEVAPNAWGTTVPLRIANSFLKRVIDKYPAGTYNRPAGVQTTTVCTDTGETPAEGSTCPTETSVCVSGSCPKTDTRQTVEVCTATGLIPTNLTAAQKFGLTTTKIVLSTKIGNTLQQDAYEKYFTTLPDSNYLFSMPASGICPLPLGPDNSPTIDIESPTGGQSVEAGSSIQISGSVYFLDALSEFKATFDGNNISSASQSDGTFSFNYTVPSSTSTGNHIVTISAKDSSGKTTSENVTVSVLPVGSGVSLSITTPTSGANVASQIVNIVANVSGSVDSVIFKIQKGSSIIDTITDSNGSDGWVAQWNTNSLTSGQYIISISATKGSTTIAGPNITVSI